MTTSDTSSHDAHRLAETLAACPCLRTESPQRDAVWFAVRDTVCTRGTAYTNPLGSLSLVLVTEDYATIELIAVMEWLLEHEEQARAMEAQRLYQRLRGQATRGGNGSGRAAQADQLHGLTNVSPGAPVRFVTELLDAAS